MRSLSEITDKLGEIKPLLAIRYGVNELAVFGSYARNQQRADSDVDILVSFNRSIGIEFIDLAEELENILNVRVDLVSKDGVKEKYYAAISRELRYV